MQKGLGGRKRRKPSQARIFFDILEQKDDHFRVNQ